METATWEEYMRYREERELVSRSKSADKAVACKARKQMKQAGLDPAKLHTVYLASDVKKLILDSLELEQGKAKLTIISILEKTKRLWEDDLYTIRDSFRYAGQLELLLNADTAIEVLDFVTKRFEALTVEEWDTLAGIIREWLISKILENTTGTRSINACDALMNSAQSAVYKEFMNTWYGQWVFVLAKITDHNIRIYNDLQEQEPAAAGLAAGQQEAAEQE